MQTRVAMVSGFFDEVNQIGVSQSMCGAPGRGKFRLPGARITSVFKIRKSVTPSSPM